MQKRRQDAEQIERTVKEQAKIELIKKGKSDDRKKKKKTSKRGRRPETVLCAGKKRARSPSSSSSSSDSDKSSSSDGKKKKKKLVAPGVLKRGEPRRSVSPVSRARDVAKWVESRDRLADAPADPLTETDKYMHAHTADDTAPAKRRSGKAAGKPVGGDGGHTSTEQRAKNEQLELFELELRAKAIEKMLKRTD
jgi:hypothetical protein